MLGADRHERTEEHVGYRNGYRPRMLTTQVGDIDLQIPKLLSGSFLPSILDPRAPPACGSGPLRRGDGGLCGRCVHPQGRCPGCRPGQPERDLQIPGQPHLR
ncbi:transposase [Synechococcus sp. CCY9202]|uniref:transposase n=1 Tax=Synechococcus sp. CCY9202 TaxID=174698 RepID=UPI003A4C5B1A